MRELILICCLSLVLGCGNGNQYRLPCFYDYEVQLIGDSHTALEGYSDMVEAEFAPGEVLVNAVNGLTTDDHLPGGLHFEAVPVPRVVSILLSTNDSWRLGNTPEQVVANLEEISQKQLRVGACEVVVMTPPPFVLGSPGLQLLVQNYSTAISEFCSQPGDDITCGPDLQTIFGSEHISSDQVHPSVLGHQLIFDSLMPFLEPQQASYTDAEFDALQHFGGGRNFE